MNKIVAGRTAGLLLVGMLSIMVPGLGTTRSADALQAAQQPYSHQSLLAERTGYGANASGGAGGTLITVTSDADSGPGTLRAAVERNKGPVWVRFSRDMTIELRSLVRVGSNVTIDGRGRRITLQDHGLAIFGSRNVIVSNIAVDGRFRGISQAINIARGARDVWIDHVDLSRFNDRLVNVKTGSTDVTISWSKFHNHNKVMLLNNITDNSDLYRFAARDGGSRVTLHHNWFFNTVQRNPRAQFGIYHLYNNLLENWDFYGMSFSLGARALIEGNIFSNQATRPCQEPPSFATVEGVERNYCGMIATAGTRAQLPNGGSDAKNVAVGKAVVRNPGQSALASLIVRDNRYVGSARPGITDHRPEQVPAPPYRYRYDVPTDGLAQMIRARAGNTIR